MPELAIESHKEIDDIPIIFQEDLENENSTIIDFVSPAEGW